MATVPGGPATRNRRNALGLGAAALTLGFLGLGFAFLAPLGASLSVAGLICGIIGWVMARPGRSPEFWWSLSGTLFSLAAVALNVALLNYGSIVDWLLGG